MIQYFVNILPFEKRLSKLRDLETEENELRIRVEDISSKLNLSNSIIKSIGSVSILEKAKSNQGDFIKELGTIHKRMKEVSSIKERLLKCEDIQKAIKKGGVKERFQKTKDLFKRNVITQKVWKESYKVLTGSDKVCYSDVIVYHGGKVLLLERSKIGIGEKNIGWCVPGGHVDPGEDFIQAAERELREETGIVLSEGCQLEIRGEFESDEIHIVYFEIYLQDEPTLVLDNEEHKQYCWAEPKEFDKYPMIFDMAQNLQAILGTGEVYVTKIEDVSKAIEEDEIEKGHKYYKREGSPGNYKYFYSKEEWDKAKSGAAEDGLSAREKNPFHNKELKKKLGEKALKSIRDGKMGEYTKVVAADYGLTFREAIDLLAESTRLIEDSENKVGDSISEDFSKINKEAVRLWMDAAKSHSKEKKSLIEQARRKVSEGFNGLTKDLPAKEKYDLAGKLIVQFKNPLVASTLNSIQEGLRHSINIEAMSPRHGL